MFAALTHRKGACARHTTFTSDLTSLNNDNQGLLYRSLASFRRSLATMGRIVSMMLALSAPAFASLQVVLGNPGLTHFDSDGGVQLDFGLTDQNGQPVGNLTKNDVQVFEDGQPAKILYFRGVGQGRPVDIVFVLDITESMQPYIDAVKQNMINFAQDLAQNHRGAHSVFGTPVGGIDLRDLQEGPQLVAVVVEVFGQAFVGRVTLDRHERMQHIVA